MDLNKVKKGLYIKVVELGSTMGMLINQKYLDVRKVGITGTILGHVPGHGGDVWWVKHDEDGQVGAYSFDEFIKT